MRGYVAVLYGEHGGVLDREDIVKANRDTISDAVTRLAERVVFVAGDRIVIERIDRA